MLVLSRKKLEKIVIGEEVVITVVRLQAGQVTLGFEAPKRVSIRRGKLPSRTVNKEDRMG